MRASLQYHIFPLLESLSLVPCSCSVPSIRLFHICFLPYKTIELLILLFQISSFRHSLRRASGLYIVRIRDGIVQTFSLIKRRCWRQSHRVKVPVCSRIGAPSATKIITNCQLLTLFPGQGRWWTLTLLDPIGRCCICATR